MLKLSFSRVGGLLLLLPLLLPAAPASAQQYNSLVKGSEPAVYFFSMDGKRYAFPNYSVYQSWYPGAANIAELPADQLASMPLGGMVTMKPGTALIKITTDPKVYAVSKGGVLRWIASEILARELYGMDWNKKVYDISDVFFINYKMGAPINQASEYSVLSETMSVTHPGENLGTTVTILPPIMPPSTNTPVVKPKGLANVSVSLSSSQSTQNQTVTISAEVTMYSASIKKLEIFRDTSATPIATCLNSLQCSGQFYIQSSPAQERFYAVATNVDNETFQTESPSTLTVAAVSTNLQVSLTPNMVTAGARSSFTSIITSNQMLVNSHKIYARIPGVAAPVLWKDCKIERTCAGSTPFYRTTSLFAQVLSEGQTYVSSDSVITVSGVTPKPVLTISGKPGVNQVTFDLIPPFGEDIGVTSISEGSIQNGAVLSLCDQACSLTIQVKTISEITAYTMVGGKYEKSETFEVKPE